MSGPGVEVKANLPSHSASWGKLELELDEVNAGYVRVVATGPTVVDAPARVVGVEQDVAQLPRIIQGHVELRVDLDVLGRFADAARAARREGS